MQWTETRQFLSPFFPEDIRAELDMLLPGELREIRIRANRPTVFVTAARTASLAWSPDQSQLERLIEALSEHSLYARSSETGQGYLTLRGGHRLGLCGQVTHSDHRSVLLNIGSVCLRIAGEWPGSASFLLPYLAKAGKNVLVIGPPGSGKTTLLRDLARQLSCGPHALQVGIADERCEIAACVRGIPQLDTGICSDVLSALPKAVALPWLIRSMCPQVIITDELGCPEDAAAVAEAQACGAAICASAHGTSPEDAAARPALSILMARKVFDLYVILREAGCQASILDRNGTRL